MIKLTKLFVLLNILATAMITEAIAEINKQDVPQVFGIVDGKPTNIKKHKYQVAICTNKMQHLCSGVIVGRSWILTTATCVVPYITRPSKIVIRAGSNNVHNGGQTYKAERIIIHEDYDLPSRLYDFALVKTGNSIMYNKETYFIQYSTEPMAEGKNGVVSGWGGDNIHVEKRGLKELSVTVLDFEECKKDNPNIVADTMMCVDTAVTNLNGVCDYSAGDPIVSDKKVVGLFTSYAKCTDSEHPALFSDVAFAADWMDEFMKKS